jgi:hypothetical protein
MFSALLDVALGLILLYTVLSLMASAINEAISLVLQLRAKTLQYFIGCLLAGLDDAKETNHPITLKDFYDKTIIAPQSKNSRLPTYIDAENFVQAILELLRPYAPVPPNGVITESQELSLPQWKAAIDSLPAHSPLRKVMNYVANKTTKDVAELRKNLADWFNAWMDQVRDTYARETKTVLLIIGMVVAVVVNIDTITITNALLQNPALRESIANQASMTADELRARATAIAEISANAGLPTSTVAPNAPTAIPGTPTPSPVVQEGAQAYATYYQLQALNIPIGWPDNEKGTVDFGSLLRTDPWWLLRKLLGLVITGFAVSQGAPFWFDLLNKVSNLRAGGKPPETAATMAEK